MRKERLPVTCTVCGNVFWVQRSRLFRKCCSVACGARHCGKLKLLARENRRCPECSAVFSVRITDSQRYCSNKCGLAAVHKIPRKKGRYVGCLHCETPVYSHNKGTRKYCSRVCQGKHASACGIRIGANNGHWKGGISPSGGYLIITAGSDSGTLHHRKVMERYLGRPLLPDEIVHHKNGVKTDNRIGNLEVMTRSEHINHHRAELQIARGITEAR